MSTVSTVPLEGDVDVGEVQLHPADGVHEQVAAPGDVHGVSDGLVDVDVGADVLGHHRPGVVAALEDDGAALRGVDVPVSAAVASSLVRPAQLESRHRDPGVDLVVVDGRVEQVGEGHQGEDRRDGDAGCATACADACAGVLAPDHASGLWRARSRDPASHGLVVHKNSGLLELCDHRARGARLVVVVVVLIVVVVVGPTSMVLGIIG